MHTLGSAPVTPMCDPVWFEDSQRFPTPVTHPNGRRSLLSETRSVVGMQNHAPVVVGLHEGLPASAGLDRFLSSLRLVHTACSVFIISEQSNVGTGVALSCKRWQAKLHLYARQDHPLRARWNESHGSKRWNERLRKATKFAVARTLLLTRAPSSLALLVDVSDVVFQADPFAIPFDSSASLYLGAEANIYGEPLNPSSVGNGVMLRSDNRNPASFAGRPVLNSGVILGRVDLHLEALKWLLSSHGAWCDQGRWNAYARLFPANVTAARLTDARFASFDRIDIDRLGPVDQRGRLLNCHGQPYAVLHRVQCCIGRACAQLAHARASIGGSTGPAPDCMRGYVNAVSCSQPALGSPGGRGRVDAVPVPRARPAVRRTSGPAHAGRDDHQHQHRRHGHRHDAKPKALPLAKAKTTTGKTSASASGHDGRQALMPRRHGRQHDAKPQGKPARSAPH